MKFCLCGDFQNTLIQSKGKRNLKCLDKQCIIWSHRWCQNVNSFLLTQWQITERIAPPPFPRTHTSGVNIPHKQTQGQTWKSMEGSTHTLVLSAPTPPPTQTHTLSLRGYSEWWRVSVFTLSKWQPLEVLLCFLDCTVHALLSVYFPNVSICGFTLGGYCRNSILKAMMTQQQATQGLFRSPGENK